MGRERLLFTIPFLLISILAMSGSSRSDGDRGRQFEVSITNVTKGQTFTPILVASHRKEVQLFDLGSEASPELEAVAETGDTGPLAALLESLSGVKDVEVSAGLLGPGQTATVRVDAGGSFRHISAVAMLIPTNDGFFALNGIEVPFGHGAKTRLSPAYDAGSEVNDELCANIPGPQCGGSGAIDAGTDENGVVHINAAIQGVGDLEPSVWDWRNPVARIVIRRAQNGRR
jgi:Spondin_N